jgi:hypothetical protein
MSSLTGPEDGVLVTGAPTSNDAPWASVKGFGTSEFVVVCTLLSTILTSVYGQDWGLAEHVQSVAAAGVVLLPIGLAIARSLKHRGAMAANATVAVAQIRNLDPAVMSALQADLQLYMRQQAAREERTRKRRAATVQQALQDGRTAERG